MKYRKKPVVIESFQLGRETWPAWFLDANDVGKVRSDYANSCLYIRTLEGEMRADKLDYIIQGVKGEIYPCKPDIFAQTYEAIDE